MMIRLMLIGLLCSPLLSGLALAQEEQPQKYALLVGVKNYPRGILGNLKHTLVLVPAPRELAPRELVLDLGKGVKLELVRIPSGSFRMGSTAEDVAAMAAKFDVDASVFDHETPAHMVRIEKDFWMGRTEVTRGQFARFVSETGYQTEAEKDGKGGWGWNADEKKKRQENHIRGRGQGGSIRMIIR